jgi:hypothetical protein
MCYTFYSTEGPVSHVCALEFTFLLYGVLRAAVAASIIYAAVKFSEAVKTCIYI